MSQQEERLGEEEAAVARPRGRPPGSTSRRAMQDERVAAEREYGEREVTEDRELDEDERFESFLASQEQSVLPDLPKKPGYHVCWLTTSNARDTIQARIRMGYRLIRVEDCPGWEGVGLKTGDYSGFIGVNEMVAAEIPERLYQRMMAEVHHRLPLSEEEKLRALTDRLKEDAASLGARIQEGDGMAEVVQRASLTSDSFAE